MGRLRARLARTPPGYRLTIGRVLAIYGAIMVALLLAALDQTIVATSLPAIVDDLGGLTSYSWVITSYILAMTVTVPLYGKLGDIYGRRRLWMFAISIFLLGSALCGLAQSMNQLVAFRVVQGLGAGGLFALAHATIGVIVPPRDRGRYQGLFGSVFIMGSILGPALGGILVDQASWRWAFYVNLPVGALALVVIAIAIPKREKRLDHYLDIPGAALLAAGSCALLLGLVWGRDHGWGSPRVLSCLAAAAALIAVFAYIERRAPEPILPFDLLRHPTVATGVVSIGLAAMAMVGTIAFVPLFVQGVIGTSATTSGAVLTPFMLGAVLASAISGQWISRTGRYRPNALAGPIVLGIGLLLLSRMDTSDDDDASGHLHGRGRGRARPDDAGLRHRRAERRALPLDRLRDRPDAVLPLDRRHARRDADGRDHQPRAARRHRSRECRGATTAPESARRVGRRHAARVHVGRGALRRRAPDRVPRPQEVPLRKDFEDAPAVAIPEATDA